MFHDKSKKYAHVAVKSARSRGHCSYRPARQMPKAADLVKPPLHNEGGAAGPN